MGKLIALILVVLALFVVVERDKLFVRDPLAHVTRNGVQESGAQVFINYHNDVLIENDNASSSYIEMIQAGQPIGVPKVSVCVHWVMCLMDAYPVTLEGTSDGATVESMDAKTVTFTDTGNKATVVTLR